MTLVREEPRASGAPDRAGPSSRLKFLTFGV